MTYPVNVNDPSTPTNTQGATQGAEEIRDIKLKLLTIVAGGFITSAAGANAADVVSFIQPDINDRPAMIAGGWLPWNLNQQWGGAGCMPFHLVDSATGTEYKFDAFDGYIDPNNNSNIGSAAGQYYLYQVITPAKNQSLSAFWWKGYKTLNPVDNLTVQLWSVAAGLPNALIATAAVINGKQITSDINGQWYRFAFAAPQALVAGTQYIIAMFKSAGVDAANYYNWVNKTSTKYPNNLFGAGTIAPVFTASNTNTGIFLCEAQASDQPIQSAGTFNGRIVGSGTGTPVNRSVGYIKPLREFFPLFNPNGWSILLRGKSWTKDATIAEIMYGLHHDRINIRCAAATGFLTVTTYESDNTVTTTTGTNDISAATFKDILIVGRSMNDGADYIKIYSGINNVWANEISATGLSLIFDPLMLKQGHMWIMGGFQLFNSTTYSKLSDMTILPSADTWTYGGSATEGSVFSVSGGKLNQIKAGNTGAQDGYYRKAAIGFSNANGWMVSTKNRIVFSTNTKDANPVQIQVIDGAKEASIYLQEYWTQSASFGIQAYAQIDNKAADNTIIITGKLSDELVFQNGKLLLDGTGQMTGASATNQLSFADLSTTAGENADVIWDYFGYYLTANIYPQFTAGELHEFAVFSGDKNLLGSALYNSGIPISIKQYCGLQKNYAEKTTTLVSQRGITVSTATAATTPPYLLEPEMECFVIGSQLKLSGIGDYVINTGTAEIQVAYYVDGIQITVEPTFHNTVNGVDQTVSATYLQAPLFGLHKAERHYATNNGANTCVAQTTRRRFNVEASV